jgi:hypothetical protein
MALPPDEFLNTFNIACTHALATRLFSSHRQSGRFWQDPTRVGPFNENPDAQLGKKQVKSKTGQGP